MSGYWQPSDVGVDPSDYDADNPTPTFDPDTGKFVPGEGGGAGESLRGTGSIAHPDVTETVVHGLPRQPNNGEVQVQPRNVDHDVQRHAVSGETGTQFTVEVDPAPGTGNTFEFGWLWSPAELSVPPIYTEAVAADSPFAWWRFEETSGTAAAEVGGLYGATLVGSSDLNVVGAVGSGVGYTGGHTTHTTLGTFGQLLRAHTVEFWVNTSATPSSTEFFFGIFNDGSAALSLQLATNGTLLIRSQSGASSARLVGAADLSGINDSEWHHVVVAVDDAVAASARLRVDGASRTLTFDSGRPLDSWANFDYPLAFAARNVRGTVGGATACQLDEVALYDYALTNERADAHFAAAS